MPWTAESGRKYRLCLLDTNALSEILKRPTKEGRGFVERFSPASHAPCWTVYNLVELRRTPDLFDAFLKFFGIYPSFVLKPHELLLEEEHASQSGGKSVSAVMRAFPPLDPSESHDLQGFMTTLFANSAVATAEAEWRNHEQDILNSWLQMRSNFTATRDVPNARDAERYVHDVGQEIILRQFPKWAKTELEAGRIPCVDEFPSLKVMLHSQYYRIFNSDRTPMPQDVTNVLIMAAAPYVDSVVTEGFQAEVFEKITSQIPIMQNVEFLTLRDIRTTP